MTRWLRNKADGTIYEWDRYLAANPKCEEVSEEVAFPEKFLTAGISARLSQFAEEVPSAEEVAEVVAALEIEADEAAPIVKESRKGRKRKGVDLHTDDIPEEPGYTNLELNDEATRRLG